ncbi:MAG: hypothetical protein SGPRY_006422 [Prymnesium sp.]
MRRACLSLLLALPTCWASLTHEQVDSIFEPRAIAQEVRAPPSPGRRRPSKNNGSRTKSKRVKPNWLRKSVTSVAARIRSQVTNKHLSPRLTSSLADQANGLMLMLSAPLALRSGIASVTAVRNILLGGWVSGFGAMIIIVEMRIPLIQRWLRRDMRVLTTDLGRLMLLLCAATITPAQKKPETSSVKGDIP